ncbi:MAG: HD domain-containing phosphohydrolase [Gemmatimonadaceae bacterium]
MITPIAVARLDTRENSFVPIAATAGPMGASHEEETKKPGLLIVDDAPENIRLLVRILNRAGYANITTATDPTRVVELQALCKPDLILLDLHMPVRDGFAVLEDLAPFTNGVEYVPIMMITGDDAPEVKRKALSLGARDFINKPFDPGEVILRIRNLLEMRFLHQRLRRQNDELEKKVADRTRQLEESQVEMMERLAAAVEFRDDDTGHHTKRVGIISGRLADAIGLGTATSELIKRAAPLHDIGKVGIPDTILLKPGELTPEERAIMQTHTTIGSDMLSDGRSELVRVSQRIARHHHERWDGSGYPDRLSGQIIPLEARIVAVADFLDAVTHARPYRAAWSVDEALATLGAASGSHFDPVVVKALMQLGRSIVA